MKSFRNTLSLALAIATFATCNPRIAAAQQACARDVDCPGDQICETGQCQMPGSAPGPIRPTPSSYRPASRVQLTKPLNKLTKLGTGSLIAGYSLSAVSAIAFTISSPNQSQYHRCFNQGGYAAIPLVGPIIAGYRVLNVIDVDLPSDAEVVDRDKGFFSYNLGGYEAGDIYPIHRCTTELVYDGTDVGPPHAVPNDTRALTIGLTTGLTILQLGGLAMLVTGLIKQSYAPSTPKDPSAFEWIILPSVGRNSIGLTFGGSF